LVRQKNKREISFSVIHQRFAGILAVIIKSEGGFLHIKAKTYMALKPI
jgi:hypothetical protein